MLMLRPRPSLEGRLAIPDTGPGGQPSPAGGRLSATAHAGLHELNFKKVFRFSAVQPGAGCRAGVGVRGSGDRAAEGGLTVWVSKGILPEVRGRNLVTRQAPGTRGECRLPYTVVRREAG